MHEWSIVRSLLERVEREAARHGARAVHRVELRVGELSGVEIPLLEAAYETFRERTICAAAALAVERVPARWLCPACAHEAGAETGLRCPECGAPARLSAGDEIVLQRLELEIPSADEAAGEEVA